MINGVHHINFVVRDLATAIPVWEQVLGRPPAARDALEGRGMISARFDVGGTWLVLVQPTGPGVPADHLEKYGEGFFLMSLATDSLDAESARLGSALLQGPQRSGIENWHLQDLDVDQTCGAQLQYVEES